MLVALLPVGYSATPDSINSHSEEALIAIQTPSIKVKGFKYSYKNDLEELTLKPLKTGALEISWDSFETSDPLIGIRFRPIKTTEWTTISAANEDSSSIVMEGIEENIIFEYQVGTGLSATTLQFDPTTNHFTSL